jgi:hypothetical protein
MAALPVCGFDGERMGKTMSWPPSNKSPQPGPILDHARGLRQ